MTENDPLVERLRELPLRKPPTSMDDGVRGARAHANGRAETGHRAHRRAGRSTNDGALMDAVIRRDRQRCDRQSGAESNRSKSHA